MFFRKALSFHRNAKHKLNYNFKSNIRPFEVLLNEAGASVLISGYAC